LHDISQGFDSWETALSRIQAKILVLGISSDVLYFPAELKTVAEQLQDLKKNVQYVELVSKFGHDSFLIEYEKMNSIINRFLKRE
jgi:homoserine O-acetyltransferase